MTGVDGAQLNCELAQSYYNASLAGADMRRVAQAIEALRATLANAADDMDAWREIEDAIGRCEEENVTVVLMALRDRVARGIAREWIEAVSRAFSESKAAGRAALRARCAKALCRGHLDLCEDVAAASYPDLPAQDEEQASLAAMARYARVDAWPHAAGRIEALANDSTLPVRERSYLTVILGEVALYFANQLGEARQRFDRALELTLDSSTVHEGLGKYWLAVGELTQAQAALECAVAADPLDGSPCLTLGDCFEKEGKLDLATEWYQEGLRRQPGNAGVYVRFIRLWGRGRADGDDTDSPEKLVRRAAQADPLCAAWVCQEAGYACQERQLMEQAHEWFRRAREAKPDNPNGYVAAAYLHIAQSNYPAARDMAQAAVTAAPYSPEGYIALARIEEDQKRWLEAEREYRRSAERQFGGAAYFVAKAAQMAGEAGRCAEAERELLATLARDPMDDAVLGIVEQVVGDRQRNLGDTDGAFALLDEIRRMAGDAYEARYRARRGDLYHASEDHGNAAREYRAAIEADAGRSLYYCNLCRAWRALRHWDEAIVLWDEAPPDVRADRSFRSWIGRLLNEYAVQWHSLANYAEALPLYRRSVEIFNEDAVAQSNLALALEAAGNEVAPLRARLEEALEALRRAATLDPGCVEYAERQRRLKLWRGGIIQYGEAAAARRWALTQIRLEVAEDMIPLVAGEGDNLTPQFETLIAEMRQRLLERYGVRVPGVRVRSNKGWPAGAYNVCIMEATVAEGNVQTDCGLCVATKEQLLAIGVTGMPAHEPVADAPAWWIEPAGWQRLTDAGLSLWHVMEYPLRHMEAILARHLGEFIGCEEVVTLLEEQCNDLLDPVRASPGGIGAFTGALRALLAERASISPLRAICTRYLELAGGSAEDLAIVAALRALPDMRGRLPGEDAPRHIGLGRRLVKLLRGGIRREGTQAYLVLRRTACQDALAALRHAKLGPDAVLVVDDESLRPFVRLLAELEFPDLPVLAAAELPQPVALFATAELA